MSDSMILLSSMGSPWAAAPNLSTTDSLGWIILHCEDSPVCWGKFGSIAGPCALHACSYTPHPELWQVQMSPYIA